MRWFYYRKPPVDDGIQAWVGNVEIRKYKEELLHSPIHKLSWRRVEKVPECHNIVWSPAQSESNCSVKSHLDCIQFGTMIYRSTRSSNSFGIVNAWFILGWYSMHFTYNMSVSCDNCEHGDEVHTRKHEQVVRKFIVFWRKRVESYVRTRGSLDEFLHEKWMTAKTKEGYNKPLVQDLTSASFH